MLPHSCGEDGPQGGENAEAKRMIALITNGKHAGIQVLLWGAGMRLPELIALNWCMWLPCVWSSAFWRRLGIAASWHVLGKLEGLLVDSQVSAVFPDGSPRAGCGGTGCGRAGVAGNWKAASPLDEL